MLTHATDVEFILLKKLYPLERVEQQSKENKQQLLFTLTKHKDFVEKETSKLPRKALLYPHVTANKH